jgi:hypothetical protein
MATCLITKQRQGARRKPVNEGGVFSVLDVTALPSQAPDDLACICPGTGRPTD